MTATPTAISRAGVAHLAEALRTRLRDRHVIACAHEAAQAHQHRSSVGDLTGRTDVDSVLDREVAEAAIDRFNGAIIDILNALPWRDAGWYGTTQQCGTPIPSERLEAVPQAGLCISCLAVTTHQLRCRP